MHVSRRTFAAGTGLAAVLATASACGTAAAGGGKPNTLTYLEPQTWDTLFPPAGGFYPNGGVINNLTDRLLYQDPKTLELHPWIATDLPEVNEDTTRYTFTLREGVTYSDGSPLDAKNVVKNFDLYGKGDSDRALAVSEAINNYDHGEVTGKNEVTFHFSAPAPGFSQAVSTINSGLLSSASLDGASEDFGPGKATQVIGSGPFVIDSEQIGTQLNLVARTDYDWAPKHLEHQGRAYLDRIEIIVAAEDSVRIGAVASKQAHVARQIEAPDEKQFGTKGLTLHVAGTNGVNNGLAFRFRDPLTKDRKVRQALIAGIDRDEIISTLFTENYPLATGALAKSALGYTDTSKHYVHDPEKARKLLDDAGWERGTDGIREKDGERLSLTFNEALPQPRSKEVVTLIQEQLKEIGVAVELFPGDEAAQDEARGEVGTLQVYHSMVGRADYDVFKSQYHSANRNVLLNGYPDGSIGDQDLDDLLTDVASSPEEADRKTASKAAQELMAHNAYILPLFEEPQVFGLLDTVGGFATESIGRPSFYDTTVQE